MDEQLAISVRNCAEMRYHRDGANVAVHRGDVSNPPVPQHPISGRYRDRKFGRVGLRQIIVHAQRRINSRGYSV